MKSKQHVFNSKQLAFQEIFIGTLIYAVVLGFFNDYTDIVKAESFSTIFFASTVLEVLTFLAFRLKARIIARFGTNDNKQSKLLMVFGVWLVMFLSKFVFIWALDVLFGDYIIIDGFFGILIIVLAVTIVHRLAQVLFNKLGQS